MVINIYDSFYPSIFFELCHNLGSESDKYVLVNSDKTISNDYIGYPKDTYLYTQHCYNSIPNFAVCNRNGYYRYIKEPSSSEERCDCTPTISNDKIESFNYPDCKYLQWIYDLTILSDINLENNTKWCTIKSGNSLNIPIITSTNGIELTNFTISFNSHSS